MTMAELLEQQMVGQWGFRLAVRKAVHWVALLGQPMAALRVVLTALQKAV